jgi:hypothetical protein
VTLNFVPHAQILPRQYSQPEIRAEDSFSLLSNALVWKPMAEVLGPSRLSLKKGREKGVVVTAICLTGHFAQFCISLRYEKLLILLKNFLIP